MGRECKSRAWMTVSYYWCAAPVRFEPKFDIEIGGIFRKSKRGAWKSRPKDEAARAAMVLWGGSVNLLR